MKSIETHIAERQREFAQHPFFTRLERREPFDRAMTFAPGLTFWVMAFQDILRINESRVTDPVLRKIARHHRVEDAGHERWFLEDVAKLDPADRDLRWLFGRHHTQTRDAAYALVSEVFRAADDRLRIVLLLTVESAGHIFFERICGYLEEMGYSGDLQYFARSHLDVEHAHHLFEESAARVVATENLPPSIHAEALAMVDRMYTAFREMFDGLEARIVRRASGTFSVMPPPEHAGQKAAKA